MGQQKQGLLILLRTLLSPQQSYTKDADTSGAVHSKDVAKPHRNFAARALGLLYLGAARRRRAVVRIKIRVQGVTIARATGFRGLSSRGGACPCYRDP